MHMRFLSRGFKNLQWYGMTYRKDRLSGRSFAVLSNVRLLWAFFSSAAGGREFFTLRFPISSSQVRAWMKRAPFSLNVFTADGVSDPIS